MKYTTTSILAGLSLASSLQAQGIKTTESPYLLARAGADFSFEPIVTVGDRLPITPGTAPAAATNFAFSGIPDAMGLYKDRVSGQNILFVAHELPSNVNTTPFGGTVPDGPDANTDPDPVARYKGAWVSRFEIGRAHV